MRMIASRIIPFLDAQSLAPGNALEALFRDEKGFILYLSDGVPPSSTQERLIRLEVREALVWLHEAPQDGASFWN